MASIIELNGIHYSNLSIDIEFNTFLVLLHCKSKFVYCKPGNFRGNIGSVKIKLSRIFQKRENISNWNRIFQGNAKSNNFS